ncbi:3-oxoacyl-ACP synthase (plasmid) [Saccharobesus litoralis]|uniref:3-oxoacyl-ACP synthase n=1 Tax=Saccharobesus litoralis TaxID=2172099 RepID=A0A2S0VYC8_9ALTE|nr:BrnA antitoxin family protein [Saccharobesus litoralis]AWB69227.1 3-oxoacyl-ACP synthase [Saccharobesus litoralis]
MSKASKTDWKRLSDMPDSDIDMSDIDELGDDFFNHAELRMPAKKSVTLRLDEDVLTFLKSEGQGYQTRINKLLRNYMDVQLHRANHK